MRVGLLLVYGRKPSNARAWVLGSGRVIVRQRIASPDTPIAPAGVRIRARLLGTRVPEAWLGWAEQDVRARTWPIWQGLGATLWGAVGLLLALLAFRLRGESLGAGGVMVVVGVYGFVIALKVVMAHTESVRRMAIERLRLGWRAQPWMLAVNLLILAWLVVWFLFSRPGV